MASLEPNKWQGTDLLSLLMGGSENKLEKAGDALETLADFMGSVNEFKALVGEGVDVVTDSLLNGIQSILKINPMKAVLDAFVGELYQTLKDLRGSGIYFLDMNAVAPPMWASGFTYEEAKLKADILLLNDERLTLENKLFRDERDTSRLETIAKTIEKLERRVSNVRGNNFGGTAAYARTFNQSLDDELDFNRPILSGDAEIMALFIMFGSSSLSGLFKTVESLNTLIKSFKLIPTDGYLPLQNLRVNYTSTDVYDQKYIQLREFITRAEKTFKTKEKDADFDPTNNMLGCFVVKNNENNEIESIVPIIVNDAQITKAKNGDTSVSASLQSGGIDQETFEENASNSRIPLAIFENQTDRYFQLRNITCVMDEQVVTAKGLDPENFYYDHGTISYVPSGKSVDFLRNKGVELWDRNAPDSGEGNVILYWDYPRQTAMLTKIARGVYRSWENFYVLKKKVTADNPFDDVQSVILRGIPAPGANDSIEVKTISSWLGLRKSYFDKVEDIQDAADQEILGYQYAVAGGYTTSVRMSVRDYNSGIPKWVYLPIQTVLYDRTSAESQEVINKVNAERSAIITNLRKFDNDYANELLEMIEDKYSDTALPMEEVPVVDVSRGHFSNIAELIIPIDYDLAQSIPPDWKRFPHLTMMFPQLFQLLEQMIDFVDMIVNVFKDMLDFIKEAAESFKAELFYYLDKLNDFIQAIHDIIKALSVLALGVYVMPVKIPSGAGGLDELKKILAMSLTGNIEDVPWGDDPDAKLQFQAGPPPFGRDDYVGGYCILGGAATLLVELLEALGQGQVDPEFLDEYLAQLDDFYQKHIKGVDDTFSEDYDKMADAAEQQKLEGGELPFVELETPDLSIENAEEAAYLSGAINALNNGDTPALAGFLTNAMTSDYASLLDKAGALKNYDGSDITSKSLLAFLNAFGDVDKMRYAAELLRLTGERLPYQLALFQNLEDATAYNNFKIALAQLIALQLAGIPVNESLRGLKISVTSVDNIDDITSDLEEDNYGVGLYIAVHDEWDPRKLLAEVYNDVLAAEVLQDNYNVDLYDTYNLEAVVANDFYTIELWDDSLLAG